MTKKPHDKKAIRQKDKNHKECLILWRQGSFALLQCFTVMLAGQTDWLKHGFCLTINCLFLSLTLCDLLYLAMFPLSLLSLWSLVLDNICLDRSHCLIEDLRNNAWAGEIVTQLAGLEKNESLLTRCLERPMFGQVLVIDESQSSTLCIWPPHSLSLSRSMQIHIGIRNQRGEVYLRSKWQFPFSADHTIQKSRWEK